MRRTRSSWLRLAGFALIAIGLIPALLAMICFPWPGSMQGYLTRSESMPLGLVPIGILLQLLALFLFVRARSLLARARKLRAASIQAARALDPRPPVLYLRSFEDDEQGTRFPADPMHSYAALFVLFETVTEEEQLERCFREQGPVIAVNQPNGASGPGFARAELPEHEWRTRVTELIAASALVVARAGFGDGLLWELQTVAKAVPPSQLILLIAFGFGAFR
jgi:hypothetical protein